MQRIIDQVLKGRRSDTDMINVMQLLNYGPEKFQEAFDVALEMDNRNLVKLVYSNYNQGKIIVEFTLLGKSASV